MGVGEKISALHRGDILNDHAPLAVGGSVCGLLYVKLCYVKLGALGVLGTKYSVCGIKFLVPSALHAAPDPPHPPPTTMVSLPQPY